MASQDQLVKRVLGQLSAVASGQTPNPEDAALVVAYIPEKLADLATRNVIYIGDSEHIPDGALTWLAMAIAQDLAGDFNLQPDGEAIRLAEDKLRQFRPQDPTPVLWGVYF